MRWFSLLTIILTLIYITVQRKTHVKKKGYAHFPSETIDIQKCPFVVGIILYVNKTVTWKCTGTIFRKQALLTTASCVDGVPEELLYSEIFRVRSNTGILNTDLIPFTDHTITEYIKHPDYIGRLNTYDSNIAVVRILDSFHGEHEKQIQLSKKPLIYKENQRAMVYTWYKFLLQRTNVTMHTLAKCRTYYQYVGLAVSKLMVCGNVFDGEHFCKQMEGGPLIMHGVLFGIASYAFECSTEHIPATFTRADMLWGWLSKF